MIIECTIKRKNGSTVELDNEKYSFKPTETEPRHLAEVKNDSHISRLLAVKESFREAEGKAAKAKEPVKPAEVLTPAVKTPEKQIIEPEPAKAAEPSTPLSNGPTEEMKEAAGKEVDADALKSLDRPALLAEAKALKIKSAHLFGTEKLIAAIAQAKGV